jgi:hypothetical protein
MLNFKLVIPERGVFVASYAKPAKLNGQPVSTHAQLARFIWAKWKKWQEVETLEQWKAEWAQLMTEYADEGESFEAENVDYTEAFDHCSNNFTLNVDGEHVRVYGFLLANLPKEYIK